MTVLSSVCVCVYIYLREQVYVQSGILKLVLSILCTTTIAGFSPVDGEIIN